MGPSEAGGVVLDIGGDIGAAVIRTPSWLVGSEIEIRRIDAPWEGIHTAVRERRLPDGVTYAALFDSLASGHYEIRVRHDPTSRPVALEVEGGRVVEGVLEPQSPPAYPAGPGRPLGGDGSVQGNGGGI